MIVKKKRTAKRSKIRTESAPPLYQAAVREKGLKALYVHGLTSKEEEMRIQEALAGDDENEVLRGLLITNLQIRDILAVSTLK